MKSLSRWARVCACTCALSALGCTSSARDDRRSGQSDAAAASEQDAGPAVDPRCVAPDGVSNAPRSIADVAALLNALPKPVELPCFLQALARPLALNAADSMFSAQPSGGRRSPRVFLFFPGLTISVVPAGMGSHLLELGQAREPDHSLKAELEFPIDDTLDEAGPYHRVYYSDTLTTCGFCHQGETHADDVASPNAYVSPSLRPRPQQRVPLSELKAEAATCDAASEPERCALLHALFDQRPAPIDHEFPESYKTFF